MPPTRRANDPGNSSAVPARLRVLTLNTWTERKDIVKRTTQAIAGIKKKSPDVAFLQETVSPEVRRAIAEGLSQQYHIVFTNHVHPTFPALAYAPAAVTTFMTIITALCIARMSGNEIFAVALAAFFVSSPQVLSRVLTAVLLRGREKDFGLTGRRLPMAIPGGPDLMAQTILVRKAGSHNKSDECAWDSVHVEEVTPFPSSVRGYPFPDSPACWPWYWVQHCLLRPGFVIVTCMNYQRPELTALFAGAHLVVSTPGSSHNAVRMSQVKFMMGRINDIVARRPGPLRLPDGVVVTRTQPALTVVAGDFNAPDTSPEVNAMRDAGYTDAALGVESRVLPEPRFQTWDSKNNHYTDTHAGPDDRIDYIFVRGIRAQVTVDKAIRVFDGSKLPIVSDHFGVQADVTLA